MRTFKKRSLNSFHFLCLNHLTDKDTLWMWLATVRVWCARTFHCLATVTDQDVMIMLCFAGETAKENWRKTNLATKNPGTLLPNTLVMGRVSWIFQIKYGQKPNCLVARCFKNTLRAGGSGRNFNESEKRKASLACFSGLEANQNYQQRGRSSSTKGKQNWSNKTSYRWLRRWIRQRRSFWCEMGYFRVELCGNRRHTARMRSVRRCVIEMRTYRQKHTWTIKWLTKWPCSERDRIRLKSGYLDSIISWFKILINFRMFQQ